MKNGISTLIKRQYMDVTPTRAREYLSHNWGGQRILRDYRIDILGRAMMAERLKPQPMTFVVITNKDTIPEEYRDSNGYLMADGQHRCEAGRKFNVSFPAIIFTYQCPTWRDFLLLNMDIDLPNRSETDMNGYWLKETGRNWTRPTVGAIKSALLWRLGIPLKEVSKRERLDIVNDNISLVRKAMDLLAQIDNIKPFTRKPIMTAILDTLERSQQCATEFWVKVANMADLPHGSPELELGKRLPSVNTRYLGEAQKAYLMCIRAWNKRYPNLRIVVKYISQDRARMSVLFPVATKGK